MSHLPNYKLAPQVRRQTEVKSIRAVMVGGRKSIQLRRVQTQFTHKYVSGREKLGHINNGRP